MIDRACISLNHRCNLRCKYCHFAGKETETNNEKYEFNAYELNLIIENIIDYCRKNNILKFKLGIVGSGEPLLSFPMLSQIVDSARKGKELFHLYTITNGVSLTDEQLLFFYQNKDIIDLNFSLDGNETIHNTLRQEYKKTMTAIEKYELIFGEKPRINTTVTRQSIENSEDLIAYFMKNRFMKINFSIVTDIEYSSIKITKAEYEQFIDKCANWDITMRQKRDNIHQTYDCSKFGRLCGVGKNNIFITRQGIFPCGRFFGLKEFRLTDFDTKLDKVEYEFKRFNSLADGACYYDTYIRGKI